jgi:hypothetical protein
MGRFTADAGQLRGQVPTPATNVRITENMKERSHE